MSALDQLLAMMTLWAAVLLNAILSIYRKRLSNRTLFMRRHQ
jgi:hypothetical protein